MHLINSDLRDSSKKDIIFSFQRAYTSRYISDTLSVYAHWLRKFSDRYNIVFLANHHNRKFIERFLLKLPTSVYALTEDNELTSWKDYIKDFRKQTGKLLKTLDPIAFCEFGGLLNSLHKRDKEQAFVNAVKQEKKITFNSIRKGVIDCLRNMTFAEEIQVPYSHFIIDSQEADYEKISLFKFKDYRRFFAYDSKLINFKEHPFLRIYYGDNELKNQKKEYDWLIGFAILTPDRKWLSDYYDWFLKFKNSKVFLKDKYRDIDTFIDKDSYKEELKKARYTLMLPPYDSDFFSMIRFLESISFETVPFIHESVFSEEALQGRHPELIIRDDRKINEKADVKKLKKYIRYNDEHINEALKLIF